MKNTLKRWLGVTAGAACLALTPIAFNGGTADAGLTEAQCITCCPETSSVCTNGSASARNHYDNGTGPCPGGGGGPSIEIRY